MSPEPLLELEQLPIDYSVAPMFTFEQVHEKRAFVFKLDRDVVHLALARDVEVEMRGKDFVGESLPHSAAVEMARRFSGRTEVILYLISDRALRSFLKKAGQRAIKVLNRIL